MNIAVIGAGASGLTAAIAAAEGGAKVTVYERNDRAGRKLLATGNGRCNLSNASLDRESDVTAPGKYYGKHPEFAAEILKRFDLHDTLGFFESLGLEVKTRGELYYPLSDRAHSVLEVLLNRLSDLGVTVKYSHKLTGIERENTGYRLLIGQETTGKLVCDHADRVILSCGSRCMPTFGSDAFGMKLLKKLGLEVIKQLPSLVPLSVKQELPECMAGVRWPSEVRLYVDGSQSFCEVGEVQFTGGGISGIVIFQASAVAVRALECDKQVVVKLDLCHGFEGEELRTKIYQRIVRYKNRTLLSSLTGLMNESLLEGVLKMSGIFCDTRCDLPDDDSASELSQRIAGALKEVTLDISGYKSFDSCQTCSGGLNTEELTENLELKKYPGIYVTGEMMDIDGICGGYNLQFAWSTGHIAGECASCCE